jgi:hypothetical protein
MEILPKRAADIVAEWLRRWIANPLISDRESSNLFDVVDFCICLCLPHMQQITRSTYLRTYGHKIS